MLSPPDVRSAFPVGGLFDSDTRAPVTCALGGWGARHLVAQHGTTPDDLFSGILVHGMATPEGTSDEEAG